MVQMHIKGLPQCWHRQVNVPQILWEERHHNNRSAVRKVMMVLYRFYCYFIILWTVFKLYNIHGDCDSNIEDGDFFTGWRLPSFPVRCNLPPQRGRLRSLKPLGWSSKGWSTWCFLLIHNHRVIPGNKYFGRQLYENKTKYSSAKVHLRRNPMRPA